METGFVAIVRAREARYPRNKFGGRPIAAVTLLEVLGDRAQNA